MKNKTLTTQEITDTNNLIQDYLNQSSSIEPITKQIAQHIYNTYNSDIKSTTNDTEIEDLFNINTNSTKFEKDIVAEVIKIKNNPPAGGGKSKKKVGNKKKMPPKPKQPKKKRVQKGGDVAGQMDMNAMYNVSGLIVSNRDVLGTAMNGTTELLSVPAPFTGGVNGNVTGSLSNNYMTMIAPRLGGGGKKKAKGLKEAKDKDNSKAKKPKAPKKKK